MAAQLQPESSPLARRLGLFDATMLVMGGTVGAGIFINPHVVAERVHTPALVLGAWLLGGLMALAGAFIWAEMADRLPQVGGQYAYLREAWHPLLAFLYGWVLLLVIQTGGMAAVTVTFARYFLELTGLHLPEWQIAVIALAVLTIANCLGVKSGSNVQSVLMVMKIAAIAMLVFCGAMLVRASHMAWHPLADQPVSGNLFSAFGAAMVPVVFAYGGWQTACFVAGELKEPRRDLPRALVLGVAGVAALYLAVNYVYVRVLGVAGLAASHAPASAVMRIALGPTGAVLIALGIAVSTLGFLSQSVLTAPRVYFAMAEDRVFFRQLAWVNPRTRVPVIAITLQSIWTVVILFSGKYEQILDYVTSMDALFFGLSASCLFVLRHRDPRAGYIRTPGHPVTTALFCLACAGVAGNTIYLYPGNTLIGMAILVSGVPVYFLWKRS
ncbi:MAG TPA: amino acid permease [Candidatus Saccharimonadales bacterium]|jgi:APA family basic amino acid/polyamine antiporter|nr:amino acid permease [Candidatus Saccharimonadales bacterium]